ncbi:Hypothetical protein HVR_LOCUS1291 [uncultured virus]|nr:Hypothetical protein HVR_LOCUS1291 [uncultured virus]
MATTTPFPTINVVPAGFRWSVDAANKAGAKGAFLRVGGPQVTRRFLSGAKRSWASADPLENQTVFSTQYRITGTPDNIRTALTYAGIGVDQINQILAAAITRDNFATTMKGTVDQELEAHAALKGAKPAVQGYDWPQILWFAQNLKSAVIATKTGEQRGAVTSPGRAGTGESLADKIKKLVAGKVLDVSNMDINTGKGVRTISAPKTAKSGKFGTGRVPIISNNLEKYIRAIQLAYGAGAEEQYAADIQVVRQALANVAAPMIAAGGPAAPLVPAVTRVPSPARVPGATIAAAPTFTAAVPRVASPPRVGTLGGANLPNIPAIGNLLQPTVPRT